MNYFQFLRLSRQAVFSFALLFILTITTQSLAQEATEVDKAKDDAGKIQRAEPAEDAAKDDAPKYDAETLRAANFRASPKPEKQRFRAISFTSKTEPERQTSADDDTMMGVMGKGTDRIKLGGHVGFVVPIVARGNGATTNVGDRFVFGFPVGLTLKTKKNIAVDFEFIPTFNTGRDFVLTIHPGIIYGFAKKYAVGVRAAYDAGAGSYGFTPLISRGFKVNEKVGFFIEADFPIRSNYRPYQNRFGSIAFAMHAGFAF